MQIKEGIFYKTRDGRKKGPAKPHKPDNSIYPMCSWEVGGLCYQDNGMFANRDGTHEYDLIAEWKDEPTGPVTIETVKRINTGTFKRVHVTPINGDFVSLHLQGQTFNATELRDISELATQLADALEGK